MVEFEAGKLFGLVICAITSYPAEAVEKDRCPPLRKSFPAINYHDPAFWARNRRRYKSQDFFP